MATKKKASPTWRGRGAVGCSKCRFRGCRTCFAKTIDEESLLLPVSSICSAERKIEENRFKHYKKPERNSKTKKRTSHSQQTIDRDPTAAAPKKRRKKKGPSAEVIKTSVDINRLLEGALVGLVNLHKHN